MEQRCPRWSYHPLRTTRRRGQRRSPQQHWPALSAHYCPHRSQHRQARSLCPLPRLRHREIHVHALARRHCSNLLAREWSHGILETHHSREVRAVLQTSAAQECSVRQRSMHTHALTHTHTHMHTCTCTPAHTPATAPSCHVAGPAKKALPRTTPHGRRHAFPPSAAPTPALLLFRQPASRTPPCSQG